MKIHPIKDDLDAYHLADQLGLDACLHRILHLALRHGCKSIVEESGVIVDDFVEEHKGFYHQLFRKIPSKVIRLHFFSINLTKNKISQSSRNVLQKSYIGFCSLRPFKKQRVIEAFLPALHDTTSPGKKTFPLCLMDKTIQLGGKKGKKLTVNKTFPFIQQDGNFDCCAHVALRSMSQYLSSNWRGKVLGMKDIVELAQSVPAAQRDAPTEGLSVTQIVTVIKKMNFDVLIYAYSGDPKDWQFWPDRVVYHYVESRLPVLLGIPTKNGGHALVVIGHTFDPDEWWPDAEQGYYKLQHSGGCYHCSTTWVCEFIVNDDNFGPYMTIPKDYLRVVASEAHLLVVVPIPKEVNFKGEDAEIYAHASLSDIFFRDAQKTFPLSSNSMKWSKLFWRAYDNEKIVLRTLLMKSERIKKDYLEGDYPSQFKSLIKKTKLPSLVWLTEFSLPHLFSQHRKLLGQFITDSTTTPLFGEPADLIVRLPGQLLVRDQKDMRKNFLWADDYPRKHQYRS